MASAARLCSTISRMIRCSSMCAVSLGPTQRKIVTSTRPARMAQYSAFCSATH